MNNKSLTLIVALAFLAAPLVAVSALAQDDSDTNQQDDRRPDRARERGENHHPDRAEFDRANAEHRAAIRANTTAHRDCIQAVLEDVRANRDSASSEDNESDDSHENVAAQARLGIKECNEKFKGEMQEVHLRAKAHHTAAKAHVAAKYEARLLDARADYRSDKHDSDSCRQSAECLERHIEKLENRKNHTLALQAKMNERLLVVEAKLADAEANGNETFHLQDAKLSLQIKILKMDRMILHIDAKIAKLQAALESVETNGSADDDVDDVEDAHEHESDDGDEQDNAPEGNTTA